MCAKVSIPSMLKLRGSTSYNPTISANHQQALCACSQVCVCVCVECVCVCGCVAGWVGGWVWVCMSVCVCVPIANCPATGVIH